MRTLYQPLLRLRLRHSYYLSGSSVGDFAAEPAPATRRELARSGLVFRRLADGFAVYAELEPEASPERLLRPLGAGGLRLTFLLRAVNPHLWSISELPEYRPGRSVFYWNNLRDDQADGRLHLGDSVAGARVGAPLPLLTGASYTHRFAPAVHAASLTVTDIFGNVVATAFFSLPDPAAETSEYRFDLAGAGLVPGRYTVRDNHGGLQELYYDPEIFAGRPFGVIEILSRTDGLTSDGRELVPADYRFLDGDELTGAGEYTLQLESRSTSWRFNVVKKYTTNGFPLAELLITGGVLFTKTMEDDHRAVFTSNNAVPLSESRQALALEDLTDEDLPDKIRDLPNPVAATPLAAGEAAGSYVSEMYVYV